MKIYHNPRCSKSRDSYNLLSEKGLEFETVISDMFARHESEITGSEITDEALNELSDTLKMLENFWARQTSHMGGF